MEAKAACELLEEIESVAVSRQLYSSIFYDNRGKETFELKISSDEAVLIKIAANINPVSSSVEVQLKKALSQIKNMPEIC